MFSVRTAALIVTAGVAVLTTAGLAQTTTSASASASDQSLADQLRAKAARANVYMSALDSKEAPLQLSALEMALKDPDPMIHGMAMAAYLKRFDALTPEVIEELGGTVREDLPRVAIVNLKWAPEGTSFEGQYSAFCAGNMQTVRGQIAGSKLSINYDGVCLRTSLLREDTTDRQQPPSENTLQPCEVTLASDEAGEALEGPLHCVNMKAALKVRLPFGP